MRFSLRSLLAFVVLAAVVTALVVHFRDQRHAAWANLQSDGVHFLQNGNKPCAELWVSTLADDTFLVNGERLSEQAARVKLIRIRRSLDCLGITWVVAMDDEPGRSNQIRQSTFDLVYSSGFTQYNYVGRGTRSKTIQERHENLKSVNQLCTPPVGPGQNVDDAG